jgi:hypothetical protein
MLRVALCVSDRPTLPHRGALGRALARGRGAAGPRGRVTAGRELYSQCCVRRRIPMEVLRYHIGEAVEAAYWASRLSCGLVTPPGSPLRLFALRACPPAPARRHKALLSPEGCVFARRVLHGHTRSRLFDLQTASWGCATEEAAHPSTWAEFPDPVAIAPFSLPEPLRGELAWPRCSELRPESWPSQCECQDDVYTCSCTCSALDSFPRAPARLPRAPARQGLIFDPI